MASSSKEVTVTGSIPPANNGSLFTEGELVLAVFGPRLYEAKIIKAERCGKESKYLIHYLGWNKNWDQWVKEERLLKYNEDNLEKQRVLDIIDSTTKRTKSERLAATKRIIAAEEKRRKNELGDDTNNVSVEKLMNIPIPESLRKKLVKDFQNVTLKEKLVKLPRSPNVDDILSEYLDFKSNKDGKLTDSVAEILRGIRIYFDKALPKTLLYNKERRQYQEIVGDDISPSTIYGCEHLLRLFTRFPELLKSVPMEEETWIRIQGILTNFLKFIKKNERKFLLQSAYECAKVPDGKGKEKVH